MKKRLYVLSLTIIASMILAACGGAAATSTQPPPATAAPTTAATATEAPAATESPVATESPAATEAPAATPTLTPYPIAQCQAGKTCIRWYIGVGTGNDPEQIPTEEEVVKDFNSSQDKIQVILEIIPYDSAYATLSTEIASGNGPDIVGPVGWGGSNAWYGQWLDLTPYIKKTGFDTSVFDPALVKFYQTEEGQVGLPFAVYPSATFYVPAMFDEVGLAYPPSKYGDKYTLDGKQVDWNMDTFVEVARRLTVDKNGNTANDAGFDRNNIVQVGFVPVDEQQPPYVASYFAGAAKMYSGDSKGSYKVAWPDSWKEAWKWYYDAQWGEKPFMATGPLASAPEFGNGDVFNADKAAMAIAPLWYTCCIGDFAKAGNEFQAGILPMGFNGKVNGRVDADTIRILKTTKHPDEAWAVVSYLYTTGADKLLPSYGAMPAVASKTDAFFAEKSKEFPFVKPETWEVFQTGLSYPDNPSAEQYQPNWNEAWDREQTFGNLMDNTPPDKFDFEAEYKKLVDDVNGIYNK
jgi:multiple sugar transport system substrate-binding protein